MTRAMKMSAFVAMGLLMTATVVAAQKAPTTSGGQITFGTMSSDDVASSKFTEYREVPKGLSIPFLSLYSTGSKVDFNLTGTNVQQADQRFLGSLKARGMGLKFNFNQIPHSMGNDGHTVFDRSAPGVWSMSTTAKTALQNALNAAFPTSLRTYDWYAATLAPTLASASLIDLNGVRKTGNVDLSLGKRLPVDVTLSYKNESKRGYRGVGGINIRGIAGTMTEFANPMDELTQDFGVRASKNFSLGNVYASFNRNVYNNRMEKVQVDYLFQGVDALITPATTTPAAPAMGGISKDHFITAPDNQASMTTAGFLLKFRRNTRVGAGIALSTLTQDAKYYEYTAGTVVTPSNAVNAAAAVPATATTVARPAVLAVPATGRQPLQQASYGGKVNTTMYNLSFSSRPLEGLDVRAQYRVYDLADKSNKYVITGDMSGSNGQWNVTALPTAADPYGHATANVYDTKSSRFSASATYDFRALTLEGQVRNGTLERTSREALSGKESGTAFAAMFHASDWLGVRGTYDVSKRTAVGETYLGFQFDEAAFTNTRTGVDVELSLMSGLELTVAYSRRNVEYTDRPDRISLSSGIPTVTTTLTAAPIVLANGQHTPSGLLDSKYDSFTGEFTWTPNERLQLGAYYTVENDANTVQNSATASTTAAAPLVPLGLANMLTYGSSDKTSTFGANAVFHLVADKHTILFNAMNQKVDGLQDITAWETGTFYNPGRAGLIPAGQGGAADITDFDDTKLTTASVQYDWTLNKGWMLSAGYMYEKYDFADAFNSSPSLMPLSPYIFMKPNFGAYKSNLIFTRVNFRF